VHAAEIKGHIVACYYSLYVCVFSARDSI